MTYSFVFNDTSTMFDDLRAPATAINPPGQVSDPDWDNTNGGWLFDDNTSEKLWIILQLPHSYKEGSALYPHVHWEKTTSASGGVSWQVFYTWAKINEVRTSSVNIEANTTVSATPDTDTADKHLISAFNTIPGTGIQISDVLVIDLRRVPVDAADTYAADARLLEFDVHFEMDTTGSRDEFSK